MFAMNLLRSTRLFLSEPQVLKLPFRSKFTVTRTGGEGLGFFQRRSKNVTSVAVVRLSGIIMDSRGVNSVQEYINYHSLRPLLNFISAMPRVDALVLEINSPGGSPAQSDIIRNEIRRVAAKKKASVLSFVEDVAASGGYYLACAGDEIFLNSTSLVGSIGAISASFGLNRLIENWNIDRRVMTAGKNKLLNDPFSEVSETGQASMRRILDAIHKEFIDVVKESRGDRLKEDPNVPLFEADVFPARMAVELGLADAIAPSMETVIKERFGPAAIIMTFEKRKSGLARLLGRASSEVVEDIINPHLGFQASSLIERLYIEEALNRFSSLPKL